MMIDITYCVNKGCRKRDKCERADYPRVGIVSMCDFKSEYKNKKTKCGHYIPKKGVEDDEE